MSETRIHFAGAALRSGETIDLPEPAFRHLVQVLRMQAGASFIAFDGNGGEYEATLAEVGKRAARVALGAHRVVTRESPLQLTLAQCVSKGERMDYTLQKAVELGVTRIVPLLSSRSVVRLDAERGDKKLDHWRGVIVSACEQSGRTCVPQLDETQPLAAWLDRQQGTAGTRLTLDPLGGHGLHQLPPPDGEVTLLVGPEGGLSEAELQRAASAGFQGLRVGPRILRTETAGVATLAALQALWGDWR